MKKELRIFFTALMYFTRIRVPASTDHSPEYLQKAPRYFPLIGLIVGSVAALFFLIFAFFISDDIGILASMMAGLLITGAFHEDGLADVCDGFGGGWTKEKILLIMKDSRIGAFGAIGLIVLLGSKFLLLENLLRITSSPLLPDTASPYIPWRGHTIPGASFFFHYRYFMLCLVAAHSLSRLMPVLVIQWSDNVTDPDHSKSRPVTSRKLTAGEGALAILFALIPLIFLPWKFLLIIPPMLFTTWRLIKYFKKWIGGYTGDCLGAIQQVSELVFYLGSIFVWRFIYH